MKRILSLISVLTLAGFTSHAGTAVTPACNSGSTLCSASICGQVTDSTFGSVPVVGLPATTVSLNNTLGATLNTTTTDANGNYCFTGLQAGTYTVVVTPLLGYIQTNVTTCCHSRDSSGQDNWLENDGCTHHKTSHTECWTDSDNCRHWRDSNGNDCWDDKLNQHHCQPISYTPCPQNNRQLLPDGRQSWTENDGCQHYDQSDVESWQDGNLCSHYKDDSGRDCWHDQSGGYHCQAPGYSPCSGPLDNTATVAITACQSKSCVNFSYILSIPLVTVTVSGPTFAVSGQVISYNCAVTNTGNVRLLGGTISHNVGNYDANGWVGEPSVVTITCPTLQPGQGCIVQQRCTSSSNGYVACVSKASCKHEKGETSDTKGVGTKVDK